MQKVWIIIFALTILLIGILVFRSFRPQPVSGLVDSTSDYPIPVIVSPSTDNLIQEPVGQELQNPGPFSGQESGANFTDVAKITPDELHEIDFEGL